MLMSNLKIAYNPVIATLLLFNKNTIAIINYYYYYRHYHYHDDDHDGYREELLRW